MKAITRASLVAFGAVLIFGCDEPRRVIPPRTVEGTVVSARVTECFSIGCDWEVVFDKGSAGTETLRAYSVGPPIAVGSRVHVDVTWDEGIGDWRVTNVEGLK